MLDGGDVTLWLDRMMPRTKRVCRVSLGMLALAGHPAATQATSPRSGEEPLEDFLLSDETILVRPGGFVQGPVTPGIVVVLQNGSEAALAMRFGAQPVTRKLVFAETFASAQTGQLQP
jgi:hypothetical protein